MSTFITRPRLALAGGITALFVLASVGTAVILVPFATAAGFRSGRRELDLRRAAGRAADECARPEAAEANTGKACEMMTFVD
jgi:hypothetical protein